MQQLDIDDESAKSRTVELKEQGLTVSELLAVLNDEGYINPRTQRPYGSYILNKWAKGINDQRGRRSKRFEGFSDEQKQAYYKTAREKRLQQMKDWRKRNPNHWQAWEAKWEK